MQRLITDRSTESQLWRPEDRDHCMFMHFSCTPSAQQRDHQSSGVAWHTFRPFETPSLAAYCVTIGSHSKAALFGLLPLRSSLDASYTSVRPQTAPQPVSEESRQLTWTGFHPAKLRCRCTLQHDACQIPAFGRLPLHSSLYSGHDWLKPSSQPTSGIRATGIVGVCRLTC